MKNVSLILCSVLTGLCIFLLCWNMKFDKTTANYQLSRGGTVEKTSSSVYCFSGTVNVNTADELLLCTVPGIGKSTANAIITERESNGYFFYPEDLLEVKGIGERTLKKLQKYLCISEGE